MNTALYLLLNNIFKLFLLCQSIRPMQLCKVLGAGFDSDTLSDVIHTLHDYFLLNKDPATASVLLEVSKNKQVSILSLLMSNEERKCKYGCHF